MAHLVCQCRRCRTRNVNLTFSFLFPFFSLLFYSCLRITLIAGLFEVHQKISIHVISLNQFLCNLLTRLARDGQGKSRTKVVGFLRRLGRDKSKYRPLKTGQMRSALSKKASVLQSSILQSWHCLARPTAQIIHNWWLELLASLFAIIAFCGLVALFNNYQGQPLPKWPLGLSINTVLSVFGVIFKVPLLFIAAQGISQLKWQWLGNPRALSDFSVYDDASRGPWGSTRLLWVARWRHSAAFLGALITVAAIGIDPFTQAVVGYHGCSTSANKATASVSRLNSLNFSDTTTGSSIPPSKRVAVDGSLGDPTTIMPNYTCPADSCTFSQPYHSIGLCTTCIDVTDQLRRTCEPNIPGGCSYNLSSLPYFPNGYLEDTSAGYYVVLGPDGGEYYALWQLLTVRKYSTENMFVAELAGLHPYIMSIIDLVSAWPVLGCRCTLYFCIRTYTATLDSGALHETLHSTANNWSSYTEETSISATVKVDCLTPGVRSLLLSDGFIAASTEWMAWNGTYFLDYLESQQDLGKFGNLSIPIDCTYQLEIPEYGLYQHPFEAFSDSLVGILNGSGFVNASIPTDPGSPSNLVELYNNGTLSVDSIGLALDNFTTAVTNYLRTTDSIIPDSTTNPVHSVASDWNRPALGEAFINTTCIHVRWPWLALPAALLVTTLIFLVTLIAQTTGKDSCEVWKSSQDALLWHGLDGSAMDESANLVTASDMHRRAKELTVRLGRTGRGWKLILNDEIEEALDS